MDTPFWVTVLAVVGGMTFVGIALLILGDFFDRLGKAHQHAGGARGYDTKLAKQVFADDHRHSDVEIQDSLRALSHRLNELEYQESTRRESKQRESLRVHLSSEEK